MPVRLLLFLLCCGSMVPLCAQDQPASDPPAAAPSERSRTAASPAPAPVPETLTPDQIKDLIRQAADNDLENDKKLRDYTYTEREETRKLNKNGQVTSTESKTSEVLQIYGETVEKLIAKNDKPLSEKDANKEDERIQKIIDKRKNESDSDREKRIKKEEKEREDELSFIKEIDDAYNFHFVGVEALDGRRAWVIDAEPRPGFVPHKKEAQLLTKVSARFWIDQQDKQLTKLDARFNDTFTFGLFLARFHPGTHLIFEQTRVNDEVWLQHHIAVHLDVRVALLKNFDVDLDVADRDYKKFRTGSRIVGMGEVVPDPATNK